jgi:hypothetical protein
MPIDYSLYPDDWPAISRRIREREGNRCKWCGVANGAVGRRDLHGNWWDGDAVTALHGINPDEFLERFGTPRPLIRIVLTVAHLGTVKPDGTPGDKHDKHDVRDENLAALCQRCHLRYDHADHVLHAASTRRAKRLALQPELSL